MKKCYSVDFMQRQFKRNTGEIRQNIDEKIFFLKKITL